MEFETETKLEILDAPIRSKTSHRMHYEAQVEVIKKQVGELEDVRIKLGLSQRKISHLLMVDPSAWTRWTRKADTLRDPAPPHIYRALQWYMSLQEKIPGLTPQYFIGKDPEVLHQSALKKIESETGARKEFQLQMEEQLKQRISELEKQVQGTRVGFFMLVIASLIMAGAFFWRLRG